MIVKNVNSKEVVSTTYIAHDGAIARMILTPDELNEIGFLAFAAIPPGNAISPHVDPMEEIYFVLKGKGRMLVGEDERDVETGDAIVIPKGNLHSLANTGDDVLHLLVIAAPWK